MERVILWTFAEEERLQNLERIQRKELRDASQPMLLSEVRPDSLQMPPQSRSSTSASISHQQMQNQLDGNAPTWAVEMETRRMQFETRQLEVQERLASAVERLATTAEANTVQAERLASAVEANTESLRLLLAEISQRPI